jgi:hypothetical protein
MKLTTQQLTQLKEVANTQTIDLLNQWYPEKFQVEKKVHTFYYAKEKFGNEYLFAFYSIDSNKVYGFNRGEWRDYDKGTIWIWPDLNNGETLATEEQILKFMIPEAKKRGYKNGNYKCIGTPKHTEKVKEELFFWCKIGNSLWQGERQPRPSNLIFEKGKWAEITQTYTKEEAEKILNAKII